MFNNKSKVHPLFLLWLLLGDGPPHSLWDETQGNMLNMTSWIAKEFTERLPGISVFPTLGNHGMLQDELMIAIPVIIMVC